jgi:hypothetical protein
MNNKNKIKDININIYIKKMREVHISWVGDSWLNIYRVRCRTELFSWWLNWWLAISTRPSSTVGAPGTTGESSFSPTQRSKPWTKLLLSTSPLTVEPLLVLAWLLLSTSPRTVEALPVWINQSFVFVYVSEWLFPNHSNL